MKTLKFIDMTLRQAGPSFGKVLSFKEKLEIARSLDRLRADTIELAPISGSKADQLANRTIASMVQTRISAAEAEPHRPGFSGSDGVHLPQEGSGHAGSHRGAGEEGPLP